MPTKILLKVWVWTSSLIASLVLIASLLGIFNHATYAKETTDWALQVVGQDIGNLIAVAVFSVGYLFAVP